MRFNRLAYLGWVLLSMSLLLSCKSKKLSVVTFSDLDGRWNIVELNGKSLNPNETDQLLELDMARNILSGKAGCNRMMGRVEYDKTRKHIIRFLDISSTRRACPNLKFEQELLEALGNVARFEVQGESVPISEVVLYGINNDKLLVLKR